VVRCQTAINTITNYYREHMPNCMGFSVHVYDTADGQSSGLVLSDESARNQRWQSYAMHLTSAQARPVCRNPCMHVAFDELHALQ